MKTLSFIVVLFCIFINQAFAANQEPLWLRYAAISPDAKTIAFVYKDKIWTAPTAGGNATLLTYNAARSLHPVWSKDSQAIAYSSYYYGNSDVFLAELKSNKVQRLTYHSGEDIPISFTPDNKSLIFSSTRLGEKINIRDSLKIHKSFGEVFQIDLDDKKITSFLPITAHKLNFDKKTNRYLYEDRVAPYRSFWRKHNNSSAAYNIWLYDPETKAHQQLTNRQNENNNSDNQNPIFSLDGQSFYYLNDSSGSLNVWKKHIKTKKKEQITFFKKWPVRFLSMADNGTLVFSYDGRLWRKEQGAKPQKIAIQINDRSIASEDIFLDISSQASEVAISPNQQELGLIIRGDVFVLNLHNKQLRRITNTPGMERFLSFSPDARSLLYASEDNKGWKIKQASLTDAQDKMFSGVSNFEETLLISKKEDAFQPRYSPDGSKIAYIYDRDKINVYDIASKQSKLILKEGFIYTYRDGQVYFEWGKNNQWLLVQRGVDKHLEIYLVDASGKKAPVNLSKSGFNNSMPQISDDGRIIFWLSDKLGLRQTDSNAALVDVVGVFLTPQSFQNHINAVTKKAYYQKEQEPPADKFPYLKNLELRQARITPFSTQISFYKFSPDNTQLLIVTGDNKAYLIDAISRDILTSFDVPSAEDFSINSDFTTLYILSGDSVFLYHLQQEKTDRIKLNVQVTKNLKQEAMAVFEHNFRYTKKTFYDKNMHGVDWDAVGAHYRKFLLHTASYEGLAEILAEMQGELNASHQWARVKTGFKNSDSTASLGVYFDLAYTGKGMKVKQVLTGGPADIRNSYLTAGAVILEIDKQPITNKNNIHKQLNHKAHKQVLLTIKTPEKQLVQETVIPTNLSNENQLVYENWETSQKSLVSKLSDKKFGYVHLSAMNVDNYRKIYKVLFGEYRNSKGVIIDVRDNSGGNLTEQLLTLLSGTKDISAISRNGAVMLQRPTNQFTKPTVVITNQNSYSDGSIFPTLYQYKKIGTLIGSKVPGTGTATVTNSQIFPRLSYSVPVLGLQLKGEFLENKEITPDVLIDNDSNSLIKSEDKQLKKAIELLQTLTKQKSQPSR